MRLWNYGGVCKKLQLFNFNVSAEVKVKNEQIQETVTKLEREIYYLIR